MTLRACMHGACIPNNRRQSGCGKAAAVFDHSNIYSRPRKAENVSYCLLLLDVISVV